MYDTTGGTASTTPVKASSPVGLVFESLGPQHLKGLPDEVEVYRVTAPLSMGCGADSEISWQRVQRELCQTHHGISD
jgi:hypothetical protein